MRRALLGMAGLFVVIAAGFLFTLDWAEPGSVDDVDRPVAQIAAPPRVAPSPSGLTIPVAGIVAATLVDSWGDPRGDGTRAHAGTDIMAPAGTPVVAVTDGRIERLYFSEGGGGVTLYQRSDNGRWLFYYAHLQDYWPGIREGMRVRAGQPIARVGASGNASADAPHLHFGISAMAIGDRWWQGRPINPYPLLAGAGTGR